ncbi:MAG: GNAT family N-acetyltransferase [Gloeobacterales cyanobacterium]
MSISTNLSLLPIEKLKADHDISQFDCGKAAPNDFLKRFALVQKADSARTYVTCEGETVVGFYSLAVGSVEPKDAPQKFNQGIAPQPIPVIILSQLAVDARLTQKSIAQALLKDALLRVAQAAEIAGIQAILAYAQDEDARRFYEHFEFEASPTDAYHLFLSTKELCSLVS